MSFCFSQLRRWCGLLLQFPLDFRLLLLPRLKTWKGFKEPWKKPPAIKISHAYIVIAPGTPPLPQQHGMKIRAEEMEIFSSASILTFNVLWDEPKSLSPWCRIALEQQRHFIFIHVGCQNSSTISESATAGESTTSNKYSETLSF